jgi:Domain of unknown function (DUF3883)
MPLVLVSNDANVSNRYHWHDVTGVQYHYPNGYRNIIKLGSRFIYYRGMRRADGKRGTAEYFGYGIIGEVWRDDSVAESAPKNQWAWYCAIEGYVPFRTPVPAKLDGTFFETIPRNMWRTGVRRLTETVFAAIIAAAGIEPDATHGGSAQAIDLPPLDAVTIPEASEDALVAHSRGEGLIRAGNVGHYSRQALLIGRRAEEIALHWAKREFHDARQVRWVSDEGETPGWDIEVLHPDGQLTALEVKGASGRVLRLGPRYLLVLVSNCLSISPRLQVLANPSLLFGSRLQLQPIRYPLYLTG